MEFRLSRRVLIARLVASLPVSACALSAAFSHEASEPQALRVACLDWALAETMMALGHDPIAIVAASDWDRFVVDPALPDSVMDLGLQSELNYELLSLLKPDLILSSPFVAHLEPVLQRIAPLRQFSIFEPDPVPLEHQHRLTRLVGEQLGLSQETERYLAQADLELDGYKTRIDALRPRPVMLVNFLDARHVRVYGGAGLYQNVLDRIGLTNAWTGETTYWGFSTVGIEAMATDRDIDLMMFEPVPPDTIPTLTQSPLWTELPFVRAGQTATLPPVLMFGALPSALRLARQLVEHLEGVSG